MAARLTPTAAKAPPTAPPIIAGDTPDTLTLADVVEDGVADGVKEEVADREADRVNVEVADGGEQDTSCLSPRPQGSGYVLSGELQP